MRRCASHPLTRQPMSRRSDSLDTTLLSIELLRRIPRSGKISTSDLHRQVAAAGFERDVRSIQRLLKSLSEHFDIELDDRSKPYGYQWKSDAKGLAVSNLSPQESMLLMLAQEHMRYLLPPRLMKSMDAYFKQAQRNLAGGESVKLEREWPRKVRVIATTQPLLPAKIDTGVFAAVSEALYSNLYLDVDYRNANNQRMRKRILPLGLAQQGGRIYLACRFEGYDDERSIAVHRIQAAKVSTLGFERPKGFDLQTFDEEGRFSFGDGKRVRLTFRTDASNAYYLKETPLADDQQIEERTDGTVEVAATVVDSRLLEVWLKGFGAQIWNVRKLGVD